MNRRVVPEAFAPVLAFAARAMTGSELTANSDTDWTSAQYKEEKSYLKDMLDQNLTPAEALVPEGEWTDDSHFKVSDKFKESVQTMLKDTAPSAAEK